MPRKKGDQTRQLFLDATERLLHQQGLARVTTRFIAQEAGYSEATLYLHFENKEDLFLAVVQRYLPAPVDLTQVGQKPVSAHLEEIVLSVMHFYRKTVPVIACFFADRELLSRHQETLRALHIHPQNVYGQVARYIEAEQHLGRIPPQTDPQDCAALLLGACFHFVFFSDFLGEPPLTLTDQQFIARMVQTVIMGIVQPEGGANSSD